MFKLILTVNFAFFKKKTVNFTLKYMYATENSFFVQNKRHEVGIQHGRCGKYCLVVFFFFIQKFR